MTSELPRTPGADATRPVPVAAHRQLGDYALRERLGEGGMGVVWRASAGDGRDVAVKVLREHLAHDETVRARLRREVHTLAQVHHPRVAAVIDADVDGPTPYIVTEFVPGPPLDRVVEERGPLRGERLVRLARGLAEALRAIHAVGIVHRDLKPGNVLLVGDDPVVIDFGIAQVADDARLTMTGMVMGTPGYLSPEVVEGGRVGEATDWWGWAATLAYAASGQPPFGRGPLTVVLDRVARGRVQLDGVDPALRPLLAAALEPDPARRPTQAQVLDGLERYARHEDVTGALPTWAAQTGGVGADATQLHGAGPHTRVAPQRPDRSRVAPPAPVRREPAPVNGAPPTAYPDPVAPAPLGGGADPASPPPGAQGGPDPRIGRSPRSGTLAAMLVAFVGLAAAAPLLAWGLYLVWGVTTRTVDRSLTGLVLRRHEAGKRRSDVPVLVVTSPWHLLGGALTTMFSLILPLGLAVVVALVLAGLVTSTEVMTGVGADHPVAVAAGSLVGGWVGWWGLGSRSMRRGSRTVVRTLVPLGTATLVVVTFLVVGGLALAGWSYLDGGSVSWWPLGPDFDPRVYLPFEL
ncbi:protein kinase [Ornithinimicrobium sp. LYQ121]|uniref:serine/threonine-protein kinase n=1 Tax=Ornithinimicrobium sp. LYQ121 TaxID=3378801 RepID=UPI0038532B3B